MIGERFEVKGYPTLKFFSNGMEYPYEGERTQEAITAFVTGGFKEATNAIRAHGPPPLYDVLGKQADKLLVDTINSFTPLGFTIVLFALTAGITSFITYTALLSIKVTSIYLFALLLLL
jgi:hypothetical protein